MGLFFLPPINPTVSCFFFFSCMFWHFGCARNLVTQFQSSALSTTSCPFIFNSSGLMEWLLFCACCAYVPWNVEFSIRALSGQSAILLITSGEFCVFPMLVHKTRGLFKNLQFILKEKRRVKRIQWVRKSFWTWVDWLLAKGFPHTRWIDFVPSKQICLYIIGV